MCRSILKQSKRKEILRSSIYSKEVEEGSGMVEINLGKMLIVFGMGD